MSDGDDVLAIRMDDRPTQTNQLMLPSVLMLDVPNPTAAAMATKPAVQMPCVDTAFSPIEVPSIPDPAISIQSAYCQ